VIPQIIPFHPMELAGKRTDHCPEDTMELN
jgi:hypothetical protein